MNLKQIHIDRDSHVPIAEQISDQILTAILDGTLVPGEKLPPERDLAENLDVSRGTVKRAYGQLVDSKAIDMRPGSGSYVLKNNHLLEENQKRRAANTIALTFSRLRDIGLSDREIFNLVNLHYLSSSKRNKIQKRSVMVVSNNHDILSELQQQLAYLTDSSPFMFTLSFLTIGTILGSPDPIQLLLGYDLVMATSIDYPAILEIAPKFKNKVLEALLTPSTKTLIQLSQLPEDSRIGVVYRTKVFRKMVLDTLASFDFQPENIVTVQELDYHPDLQEEQEITVLLNFNESPVYTNPAFQEHNEKFLKKGGKILRFDYQIERNSLLQIEDRIQQLLTNIEE